MVGGPRQTFAKARQGSSLSCVSQYDITVWVPGHPIIGIIRQDVMCLGSDWANLRVLSQDQSTMQTRLRRKYPMCQGSVGCATSVQEFLSCWLFKRDAPHCGFVRSWDNKVMNRAASEEGICPHTLLLLLSLSLYALGQFTHTHTYIHRPSGWRNLWAVGLCRATLQGRGHKTKALVTWKNSCNLQEEVEHLRDDGWILSVLFWAKCQSWGGCCWLMFPLPSIPPPLFTSFDAKCTSCSPLQAQCRHPPCAAQGPSGALLWTWQLQGTFLPWKVYLVISPKCPEVKYTVK